MAELNYSNGSSRRKTSLKQMPKTDLTAMVDLAFLLITFFMLTTSLSQSTEMLVSMPVKEGHGEVPDDRTMTVCLGANNQMLWYMGTTDNPQSISLANSSVIRHALLNQMKSVLTTTGKPLIVLIKPHEKSNFKNLVDVLDELAIVKVPTYAIVDITPKDEEMLVSRAIY